MSRLDAFFITEGVTRTRQIGELSEPKEWQNGCNNCPQGPPVHAR